MDNNHKIPALLPQKLVKALAEYMDFKPDGTAQFGKDVEIDGALKTNEMLVMELLDYQFDPEADYPTSPFGIYHFTDADEIIDFTIIGYLKLRRGDEDQKIYIDGFVSVNSDWYYSRNGEAYVLEDRSNIDYNKAGSVNFSKIFRHTVTITCTGSTSVNTYRISFTDYSDSNLKIDSYQDLRQVFGGKRMGCSGVGISNTGTDLLPMYIDLHGGTVSTNYIMFAAKTTLAENKVILGQTGTGVVITYEDDVSVR